MIQRLRFGGFQEWEAKSLSDICDYATVQGKGIVSDYVGTENLQKEFAGVVFDKGEKEVAGILYHAGDTLVSNIRPYLHKTWFADKDGVCSTDVLVFHPNGINSSFLYNVIANSAFFDYVMTSAKGSKMPRGDKKFIMKKPIQIPVAEEQQKIADFLTTYDKKISLQQQKVEALERRKKGLLQKVFSQEIRFKADDGSEFPEWEGKTLGDIGTVLMCKRVLKEQTSPTGDIPFFKIGTFGGTPDAFISKTLYEELKTKYSFPKKGNILLSAAGTIGRAVVYDGKDAFFQDSNIVWLDHNDTILDSFLLYFYKCTQWDNLEGGTVKRLYNGLLLSKKISVPSIEEQQKIADFFSAIDKQIEIETKRLESMQAIKKGLLQQMFC